MKKLLMSAVGMTATVMANANFTNGDLVVGIQTTATGSDASLLTVDKTNGSTLGTVGLTNFRFSSSSVGGGIKMNGTGTEMVMPGGPTTGTQGRIGKVLLDTTFTQAIVPGSAPRGAVISSGSSYFVTQAAASGGGLFSSSLVFDNTTVNSLTTINTNTSRTVNGFNGEAFVVRASTTATVHGVLSGPTGTTLVAASNTPASSGFVDAVLSWDGLSLYAADERTTADGGIYRFSRPDTSSTFTLDYILSTDTDGAGSLTTGARFLSVDWSGSNPVIYSTTAESANNRLVRIDDLGIGSTATFLSSAGASNLYKGVVVVPEPASMIAIGLGIAGLAARRRRASK